MKPHTILMSDNQSVLSWLEGVDIENQVSVKKDHYRGPNFMTRSRKRELDSGQGLPRRTSRRVEALRESTGNSMPQMNNDRGEKDSASNRRPQGSPVKTRQTKTNPQRPLSTPAKKSNIRQYTQTSEEKDADQRTPDIGDGRDAQGIGGFGDATPRPRTLRKNCMVELPPLDVDNDFFQYSPTRGSTNDDASSTRSRSPVKKMADLSLAQRPTYYSDLDGSSAENLGGFLESYSRLVQISRGQQVIPRHLRVLMFRYPYQRLILI